MFSGRVFKVNLETGEKELLKCFLSMFGSTQVSQLLQPHRRVVHGQQTRAGNPGLDN